MINIAVAKGRVCDKTIELLASSGISFETPNKRALVLYDKEKTVSLTMVKGPDVATYVENSVADIGIVGKDILDEKEYDVYEILDLGIGECKMCLAGFENTSIDQFESVTIASKYPNQALRYLKSLGKSGRVIKLEGSVELGPIVGISNFIVDIVETGRTLVENNLCVLDEISDISTRVIANKVTYKTKNKEIEILMKSLQNEGV